MTITWVLIADRGGARLFEHRRRSSGLQLLQDLPHPEGRMKNGEIDADKHGRSFDTFGAGRHAMSTSQEPTEHLAAQFARELADVLNQGFQQHRFERLILVAAPRFLGDLRNSLSDTTKTAIKATLNKDLSGIPEQDLPQHLSDLLPL